MQFITTRKFSFWKLLIFLLNLDLCLALRDVRVRIPHAVRKGEKAVLECLYDLEGDSLYSVKWYKGRREFYSFTPKEAPAMKVFQFAGVKVDRSSSNESQLVLENVNAATSGKYSCEVSADAPSFHTLIGAGELEVVVPGKDPVITGIRSRYKVGDIVRGNCTSSHSRPAANITWTVNGYETNPAHVRHFKPHKDPRELETVISAIHFVVTPQHFIYGKLKIRCTAFIHDVYWKSTEKSIEENRLSKDSSSNVVHKFSEDYFDLEEDNVVDRSDTYMTHIKGDVSSLNASSCSAFHKFSCFWPRLTTLSLIMYAVQQMLQLLQQFLTQTTRTRVCKSKNKSNDNDNDNKEEKNKNLLKITTTTTTTASNKALKQQTSGTLAIQVATIYAKNKQQQRQNEYEILVKDKYWPKEIHFQIEPIKQKRRQQLLSLAKIENKKNCQQLPVKHSITDISLCNPQQQQQQKQQQTHIQLHLYLYLQPKCDKILYVATTNIYLPANNETFKHISIRRYSIFNMKQFSCFKNKFFYLTTTTTKTPTNHNLNAVSVTTTGPNSNSNFICNSLNAATCLNICCTCTGTRTRTRTGSLTSKDIFFISTTTTKTTITTTT